MQKLHKKRNNNYEEVTKNAKLKINKFVIRLK